MLIFLKYQGLPYTVHVMWITYNKYHFSVQGLAFVAANHILIWLSIEALELDRKKTCNT